MSNYILESDCQTDIFFATNVGEWQESLEIYLSEKNLNTVDKRVKNILKCASYVPTMCEEKEDSEQFPNLIRSIYIRVRLCACDFDWTCTCLFKCVCMSVFM